MIGKRTISMRIDLDEYCTVCITLKLNKILSPRYFIFQKFFYTWITCLSTDSYTWRSPTRGITLPLPFLLSNCPHFPLTLSLPFKFVTIFVKVGRWKIRLPYTAADMDNLMAACRTKYLILLGCPDSATHPTGWLPE